MPLKLGLCTMIYLDYATLEDAIERTAKFGYQGIDIWADSPHLDPLSRDKGYRKEIKKQSAFGFGSQANQLAFLLCRRRIIDILEIRRFAAQPWPVIYDFAIDLTRCVVDERHGPVLFR